MVSPEVSLGTWEPDPVLIIFFRSQMTSCSVSQKVGTELGQAPTSQARPRDINHLRPSNLAARTLHSVEHISSTFGYDPCPVRQGLVAAVKRCVRKARFFAVREQNKGNQSLVWVSTPQRGKSFLFSVFQSHNCWPKADYLSLIHI